MDSLAPVLSKQPFLEGLGRRHLDLLAGCASQVRFTPGEFLFRLGEEPNSFYLVRFGKVALELYATERGAITLMTAGEGEAVGWSWLVPPHKWELDARAIAPTLTMAFDAVCLRRKCEEDHDLGFEMYKRFAPVIARRVQAASLQVLDTHREYP